MTPPPSAERRIEKLSRDHQLEDFDCGVEELNKFLKRFAWQSQQASASRTYVGLVGQTVVGFYTLAAGSVTCEEAPQRISKRLARHPIPILLIARLAVDGRWQRRGVGAGLLKDAMLRGIQAAHTIGIRAIMVHAKDEGARKFYERFDFMPSPSDPLHLFVLLKDMKRSLA